MEPSWAYVDPLRAETSTSDIWDMQISKHCLPPRSDIGRQDIDDIWEDVVTAEPIPNYRTWETLGQFDHPKQPQFIMETPQVMFHLRRIRQANTLQMASRSVRR